MSFSAMKSLHELSTPPPSGTEAINKARISLPPRRFRPLRRGTRKGRGGAYGALGAVASLRAAKNALSELKRTSVRHGAARNRPHFGGGDKYLELSIPWPAPWTIFRGRRGGIMTRHALQSGRKLPLAAGRTQAPCSPPGYWRRGSTLRRGLRRSACGRNFSFHDESHPQPLSLNHKIFTFTAKQLPLRRQRGSGGGDITHYVGEST